MPLPSITDRNQARGLARWGMSLFAGFCIGYAMGAKWLNAAQIGEVWDQAMAILGPVSAALGLWWSIKANSKGSILKAAADLPEVKDAGHPIVVTDAELAKQLPENVICSKDA